MYSQLSRSRFTMDNHIYLLIIWDDVLDHWVVLDKVIADSYNQACELMGAPIMFNLYRQVIPYSDVDRYEVKEAADEYPISNG